MKKFISSVLICVSILSTILPNFCYATGEDTEVIVINHFFGNKPPIDIISEAKDISTETIIKIAKFLLNNDAQKEEKISELVRALETYRLQIQEEKVAARKKAFEMELAARKEACKEWFVDFLSDVVRALGITLVVSLSVIIGFLLFIIATQ